MIIKSKKLYITLISITCGLALLLLLAVQVGNIYPGAAQYEESGEIVTVERGAWDTEVFEIDRTQLEENENLLVTIGLTQIDQMERAAGSSLLLLFIALGAALYVSRVNLTSRGRKIIVFLTYFIAFFIICYVIVNYTEMVNVIQQSLDQMEELS